MGLTAYYVQIDNGAFQDLSGNLYAGISDETTWNFTTVDVTTFSPADSAINVPVNANLVIDFGDVCSGARETS